MLVEILDMAPGPLEVIFYDDNPSHRTEHKPNSSYGLCFSLYVNSSLYVNFFFICPITIPLNQMEKLHDEVKMKYCMNDSIIHDNDSVCL
jgi:hypothetical protein